MVLVNSSIFRTPYLKNWSYKIYPATLNKALVGFYSGKFYMLNSFLLFFFPRFTRSLNFFVSHYLLRKFNDFLLLEIFVYDPSFYIVFDSLKSYKNYHVVRRSLFLKIFLLKSYFSSFNFITISLCKDISNFLSSPLQIKFRLSHLTNFSSSIISTYMVQRLGMGISLGEAIKPVLKSLKKKKSNVSALKGIKVICSGRFTRKQRASSSAYSVGSIPLSSYSAKVDYNERFVRLKYGICNIKVWVCFKN